MAMVTNHGENEDSQQKKPSNSITRLPIANAPTLTNAPETSFRPTISNYVIGDANNPTKARQIMEDYLKLYGDAYTKKTGLPATDEIKARIWNGGPNGWNKNATIPYWQKIQAA
jgi:hypothetical protein